MVGPLICEGSVVINDVPKSCNDLKLKGTIKSGIYPLKEIDQSPRIAYCDMSKQGYFNSETESPIYDLKKNRIL